MATLTEVCTEIRRQSDTEGDDHIGSTELENIAIRAYREGWTCLLSVAKTYFVKPYAFTLTTSVNSISFGTVATDFLEAYKLEYDSAGDSTYLEHVLPYDLLERHQICGRHYTVYDLTLAVEPALEAAGNYRLWYVYKPADPASGGQLLDPTGLLTQYVIDAGAIRVKAKQERRTELLLELKKELRADMKGIASARFSPRTTVDVGGPRRWNFNTRDRIR